MRAIRAYIAIVVVFIRASLQNELAYRVNLFVNVGLALVGLASAVAGVAVVFSHTTTLRGWTFTQTLLLVGDDRAAALLGVRLHTLDRAIEHALREWEATEPLAAR